MYSKLKISSSVALLLTFSFCYCGSAAYGDSLDIVKSSDINFLSLELTPLIQENSEVAYEESHRSLIGLKAFQKAEEIIYRAGGDIKREALAQFLHELALDYQKASFLPEYHSFEFVSKNIQFLDDEAYKYILDELIELGELNQSISSLKKILHILSIDSKELEYSDFDEEYDFKLNYFTTFSKDLLKKIEKTRKLSIREFYHRLPEKTKEQDLQQTIRSLHLAALNELESFLTAKFESLRPLDDGEEASLKNKKIVIFTCSYGTGHNMTALAVKQMLNQKGADVAIHDLSTGALLGRCRYRMVSKMLGVNYNDHPLCGVDIFNEILKNQYYFVINTKDDIDLFIRRMLDIPRISGVTSPAGIFNNSWEKTQIRDLLLLEKPNQIITAYHMELNPILEVAEELGIPLLHIPTDYDMKLHLVFDKQTPSYPHFKSAVPNRNIAATIKTKKPLISSQLVHGIGIPLRSAFYSTLTEEEVKEYRQTKGIAEDEKVLFVSAGGNGQHLPHPELLANSVTWNIPLRIQVIAGKNREFVAHLRESLDVITENPLILQGTNSHVTIEVVRSPDEKKEGTPEEFFVPAEELTKILDISDASISKAGGLSIAELLFKGVPILFDHRKNPFSWELFNIQTILKVNRGISNFSLSFLEEDLIRVLNIPRDFNSSYFHFKNAADLLCQTVHQQIHACENETIQARAKKDLAGMSPEELDSDWKLADYFGEIKVITTDPSSDRFKRCREELQKIGLHEGQYTLSPGVNGSSLEPSLWKRAFNFEYPDSDWQKQGRMGCFMAHYYAIKNTADRLKEALEFLDQLQSNESLDQIEIEKWEKEVKRYSSVLILEDNIGFGVLTDADEPVLEGQGSRFRKMIQSLPSDWDMLYFIAMADNWGESIQVSPHLVRLNYGVVTKGYAVQAKMYPYLLDYYEKQIESEHKILPVDHVIALLQKQHKCYAPLGKALAYRFGSFSEVQSSKSLKNWQPGIWKYK